MSAKCRAIVFASFAVTCVAAQDSAPPVGDSYLERSVREVERRIATIVKRDRAAGVRPVRADEATRVADAQAAGQRLLPTARGEARARAWRDVGFGSASEPMELIAAIEDDVPGMRLDATGVSLLVDPKRLLPESGRGDPDDDPDAAILLATGVAPDEPLAGHYVAHALLDGPSPDAPMTTDALLARRAMAEGAANLAALVFLFDGVGLESEVFSGALRPEEILGGSLVPASIRSASPVVRHLLEFVYLDGFAQSATLARKGGFSRLALERKQRLTTRDVLHLDLTPVPTTSIPEPALPAGLGLSAVDRDSLGEQGIISLVSLQTGKDNLGLIAGDGWVVDALWRFEPPSNGPSKSGDGATIWVSRWKNDGDANDFAYGLERCLQARFPGETLSRDLAGPGQLLRRADRVFRLERTGSQVVFRVLSPEIDLKLHPDEKKKGPVGQPKGGKI